MKRKLTIFLNWKIYDYADNYMYHEDYQLFLQVYKKDEGIQDFIGMKLIMAYIHVLNGNKAILKIKKKQVQTW